MEMRQSVAYFLGEYRWKFSMRMREYEWVWSRFFRVDERFWELVSFMNWSAMGGLVEMSAELVGPGSIEMMGGGLGGR